MDKVLQQAINNQLELSSLQNKTIEYLEKRLEFLSQENTELLKTVIKLHLQLKIKGGDRHD